MVPTRIIVTSTTQITLVCSSFRFSASNKVVKTRISLLKNNKILELCVLKNFLFLSDVFQNISAVGVSDWVTGKMVLVTTGSWIGARLYRRSLIKICQYKE